MDSAFIGTKIAFFNNDRVVTYRLPDFRPFLCQRDGFLGPYFWIMNRFRFSTAFFVVTVQVPSKGSSTGGLSNPNSLCRNSSPPYEVSIVDSSTSKVPLLGSLPPKSPSIERHLNSYFFVFERRAPKSRA
jgi:hypothetical protein